MPSVQFPHNTWDSSLHPQNGPQLSQWCSYSIIKLVNLTEHCAVTKIGWRTCSMLHLNAQWGVTAPLEARTGGSFSSGSHSSLWHQTIIPHVDQNFQEIGPPALGTGGPIFLGLCGPPDQSFCQTKTSDRPLFHTQTTIFLHQIIIPSWQLTVSMHEIGSLICNQHDKLMVKMTILFLLWWNFQNFCQTKISVTENRKLLGTAFTCIATLSPCLQQNLLVILELALCIHRMVVSSPSDLSE